MNILAVHNFYSSATPSGESQVFVAEKNLLTQHSHMVSEFTRHSDEILTQGRLGILKGAMATPWNPWSASSIRKSIASFKPDVVHVHNTFPLISPSIFRAIGKQAARVLTLHNYRLVCPAAIPMRAGKVCTDCIDRGSVMPSLMHGCYRGSGVATVPLAMNVALHRWLGTWRNEVDAFIALSDFQKQKMAEAGLPAHKIHVKPNFYPGSPPVSPWAERSDFVVFVGRLSEEKGVKTLIQAWRQWGLQAPELRLVGDGPLRTELETMAAGLPIKFLGQVSPAHAQGQIAQAKLLILPSEWFEGFPMVVREAFAFGTPAAVSNIGPLPSIVRNGESGVVFPAANAEGLLSVVKFAWRDKEKLAQMGQGAREEFEQYYTESANYKTLLRIYHAAIAHSNAN